MIHQREIKKVVDMTLSLSKPYSQFYLVYITLMLTQVHRGNISSFFNFRRFFSAEVNAKGGNSSDEDLFKAAQKVVEEKVRPFVQSHHGHVSINSVKDKTLFITLAGNCNDCENKADTCLEGILEMVQNEVPEISSIKEKVE